MRSVVTFRESVVVARPIDDVFDHLSDFDRAHEWRTEVVESSMDTVTMRPGTRLREVAVVLGRRLVTESQVVHFEPPHRFTFTHVSGAVPVSGVYRCETVPGGTLVSYRLDVVLSGTWALGRAYVRRSGRRMIARSLAALRDAPHGGRVGTADSTG